MKNLIPRIFIFTVMILSLNCFAQNGPPPPMAKPANENKPLIDKIIEVSKYEQYFKNYCINHIYTTAKDQKWNTEKTTEKLNNIDFENFKFTIYNLFAKYSTEQLHDLIKEYRQKKM